jgi:hypothetical protein
MRRALLVLVVLASATVCAPADAATSRCHMKGKRVIQRVGRVVILGTRWGPTYGCLTGTGQRRRLPVGDDTTHPVSVRVRGNVVGYEMNDGCFGYCWAIVTVDLASGRTSVSYRGYAFLQGRLVIDRFGSAAWVRDEPGRELHVMDSEGEEIVSRDPSIDPRSLRIENRRLHWTAAAGANSIPLDRKRPCGLHGSATLARTPATRVYWIHEKVFGCFAATERRTFLGGQPVFDMEYYGGGFVDAAGRFATIDEGFAGRGDPSADLSVFDLSTGRRVHRWQRSNYAVRAVVLHPTGAVAWMYSGNAYRSPALAVAKSDSTGEAVELASTYNFNRGDEATLRLDGDVVSWTLDGVPGSAQLR